MLKQLKREKIRAVHFRITESDWKKMVRLALKYSSGNVSAWIRCRVVEEKSIGKKALAG